MNQLSIEYPDSLPVLMNQTVVEFERESKLALAAKMYELGRWSSGQAAQVAGMSRVRFLLECPRLNVPSVCWEQDEIDLEFKGLTPQ